MARLEAAIYSILSADLDIITLIGTRIYPLILPQDAILPAITYARVSTERESAFVTDPGLSTARIQVDIWATSALNGMAISEKVRVALHRYRGTITSVTIEESHIDNEILMYEPETEIYHIVLDFSILHQET